jgi:hypothetical protein
MTSEADRKYVGKRFRECLSTLAVHFGYANASQWMKESLLDWTSDTWCTRKSRLCGLGEAARLCYECGDANTKPPSLSWLPELEILIV